MILDDKLVFSNGQAITDTAASTNVLDFGLADANEGDGTPKRLRVEVETAMAKLTSLKATLQESVDNDTFTTLIDGVAVLLAAALPGKKLLDVPLPITHKRYLRINYTVVGTTEDEGTVNAFIVLDAQNR